MENLINKGKIQNLMFNKTTNYMKENFKYKRKKPNLITYELYLRYLKLNDKYDKLLNN